MKKTLFFGLAALALASCTKDYYDAEWSGSYNYGEYAGRDYMMCVADNLIVDNLKQMEAAIFIDSISSETSSRFDTGGKSIWAADAEWTVTNEDSGVLEGLKLKKAAADSTWILTRNGKYPFGYYNSTMSDDDLPNYYVTDYEMELRIICAAEGKGVEDHYFWAVTLKRCERTEEKGYTSKIYSTGSPIEYSEGNFCSWDLCYGTLMMEVRKDGRLIDKARLQLNGTRGASTYIRNL